jgi:hypothetical protein
LMLATTAWKHARSVSISAASAEMQLKWPTASSYVMIVPIHAP